MHRWKFTALAAAAFASVALTGPDAHALTLGRMDVQSALGQPLRAEIDIPQATPAELEALQVEMASPQQFRAYGVDYSNAAQAVQVSVQRRSDGTPYLRLSSSAPIDDPFVDLVLSANWNAGSVLRSYTLLLDPASTTTPAVEVAQAPQVPAPTAAEVGRTYSSAPSVEPLPVAPAAAPAQAAPAARAPAATAAAAPAAAGSVRVRRGDTAGRLAQSNRHNGVSLDQMLVAMLRHNPDAFINGNVNRMRAGAVLNVPTREQAQSTSAAEARQIVAAQSRDFSAFRRSLAQRTPRVQVAEQTRTATGRVQAKVADSAPAATPDKLTLTKGAVQPQAQADEQIARAQQAAAQDSRMQELQRNLQDLQSLSATAPTTAAPGTPAPSATTAADTGAGVAVTSPTLAAAAPAPEAPATPVADAIAEAPASAAPDANTDTPTTDSAAAPADGAVEGAAEGDVDNEPVVNPVDAAAAAAAAAAENAPPASEPHWNDSPWLPVGGGLAAILLGLLGYGLWKRRQATAAPESSFMQAAKEAGALPRSDEPALDAPQATHGTTLEHADAYLSYGQDAQAEATLHEVLRRNPQELAAWVKLCDLHAKHHDLVQLEVAARSLLAASKGEGPEWEHVLQLGRQMDPRNPFYAVVQPPAPSAAPAAGSFADALRNAPDSTTAGAAAAGSTASFVQQRSAQPLNEMDLGVELPDLDLSPNGPSSADPRNLSAASIETWDVPQPVPAPTSNSAFDLDLDMLDLPTAQAPTSPKPTPAPAAPVVPTLDELHFDVDPVAPAPTPQPSASARVAAANAPAPTAASRTPSANPLGSLDLDTNLEAELPPVDTTDQHLPPPTPPVNEHLATKLDLAMEFNSIGDSEGARALIEEVLAEATGPLKDRAQQLLRQIT